MDHIPSEENHPEQAGLTLKGYTRLKESPPHVANEIRLGRGNLIPEAELQGAMRRHPAHKTSGQTPARKDGPGRSEDRT